MTSWLLNKPALFRALAGLVVLSAVVWLAVGSTRTQASPQHLTTGTGAAAQAASITGDADCSGGVNAVDALKVLGHVAGLQPDSACIDLGNVKCDDGIDAVDAMHILRHVAGLTDNLPSACAPVSSIETTLTQPASAGATEIQVANQAGFAIGDNIRIDPGTANQEDNQITGFGSLLLAHALLHSHASGAMVFGGGPPTLPSNVVPTVSVSVPGAASPGDNFPFTVTFQNTGIDPGYGPYIDLFLDIQGVDVQTGNYKCDGINFLSASAPFASPGTYPFKIYPPSGIAMNPGPVCTIVLGATAAGPHPFGGSSGPARYQRVVMELPFGSFQPNQPPITINGMLHLSDYADVGASFDIQARGGFRFGDNPNGTGSPVPIEGSFDSGAVTAVPFSIGKVCQLPGGAPCPDSESATGPNFPMRYEITVDIDNGLEMTNLLVTDVLPDNIRYTGIIDISPNVPPPVITAPPIGQTGTLTFLFNGPIVGHPGPDVVIHVGFYIGDTYQNGQPVLPAGCGPVYALDDLKAEGDLVSADPRDLPVHFVSDDTPVDNAVLKRCVAIQKSSVPPPGDVIPGDHITYTLNFQVSDYMQVGNIKIQDTISDGQTYLPTALLKVRDQTGSIIPATAMPAQTVTVDRHSPSGPTPCDSNTPISITPWGTPFGEPQIGSVVTFDVSAAMAALYNGTSLTLPQGLLTGGEMPPTAPVPATATLTFQTVVDDSYLCPVSGDQFVGKFDKLYDSVKISADVRNRVDQPFVAGVVAEDGSVIASVPVAGDSIMKCVYSVERPGGSGTFVVGPPPLGQDCALDPDPAIDPPPLVTPGDVVTFSIVKTIPSGDYEPIDIQDFLPHPVLQTGGYSVTPGLNNTCPPTGGPSVPAATTPGNNSLLIHYPADHNTQNQPCTIDILLAVTVTSDPYADGLLFTNEVSECETNSFGDPICQQAVAGIQVGEPALRIIKGVVAACQPQGATCVPTGSFNPQLPNQFPFTAPGSSNPRFSGVLNSVPGLTPPIQSDAYVDGGDIVTFAVVVENYGTGPNGAFDVKINDLPALAPPGFVMPAAGYNFSVTNGTGALLLIKGAPVTPYTCPSAACTLNFGADLASGFELVDPSLTQGALAAYNATSGQNIAVITYDLQVDPNVTVGGCLPNTATILHYAGAEAGADYTSTAYGGPNSDTAQVCVLPGITKSIVTTSEAHTGVTPNGTWAGGTEDLAIGEIIRYRLDIVLPEGVSPNFQVTDILPPGLSLIVDTNPLVSPYLAVSGFNAAIPPFLLAPALTVMTGGPFNCVNPGASPVFSFGSLNNQDQDPDPEIITIWFNAQVCNIQSNQDTVPLDNQADVSINGNVVATSTVNAKVVEPNVIIDKQVASDPQQTGNYIYRIMLTSNGSATAFDVHMTDVLPQGCQVVGNPTWTPSLPPPPATWVAGISSTGSTTTLVKITIDEFPVGASLVIQFHSKCGKPCDNRALVDWTSLPGIGTNPNPTLSNTIFGSGPVNGERDGSGGVNDYAESSGTTGLPCQTSLSIVKQVVPGPDPQTFPFTTLGGLPPFTLDDFGTLTYSNVQNFAGVAPGPYTITETPQSGWTVGIFCSSSPTTVSTWTVNSAGNSVAINLASGEHVVCTFTNEKSTNVDVGGKSFTPLPVPPGGGKYSFNVTNIGPNLVTLTIHDVLPAGVTLTTPTGIPIVPSTPGWVCSPTIPAGPVDCVFQNVAVNQTVNLVFQVNTTTNPPPQNCAHITSDILMIANGVPTHDYTVCDIPANTPCSITIIKDTVPDGPQVFSFSVTGALTDTFTLVDNGGGPSSTKTYSNVSCSGGLYTITETPLPPGWILGINCTGASIVIGGVNSVTIGLGTGQNANCTFRNHH